MDVVGAAAAAASSEAHGSAPAADAGGAHPEDTPHSPVPFVPINVLGGTALPAACGATAGTTAAAEL